MFDTDPVTCFEGTSQCQVPSTPSVSQTLTFDALTKLVMAGAQEASVSAINGLILDLFALLPEKDKTGLVSDLFVKVTNRPHLQPYIEESVVAVKKLEKAGKGCDLLQRFVQCISKERPDSTESLMPLTIYNVSCFNYGIFLH